ncbi:MAG: hypothetical protein ABSF69_05720 [Polyangiaceae bacterium]
MTTAEVTRDSPAGERRALPQPARVPPRSPLLSSAWLLRSAAYAAVAAGIAGVIIAPGIAGNASEPVVVAIDRGSSILAYFLLGLLVTVTLRGSFDLVRASEVPILPRVALIGGSAAIVALSAPALHGRIPPQLAVLIASIAAVVCLAGAYCGARTPHTRAVAGVLCAFAFGAVARLGAWELAARAGETANISLFGTSRGLATASILFDAAGQLVAVTWLGTRGKWGGQLASSAALATALVITWGVASGVHSGASFWQAILHSALADAPGVPPPLGLDALATFLVPASLLLALVAAAQTRQIVAIVSCMALALVCRGAFDAPLCALCAVAAALWTALASMDERAMWRTLIDDRSRRAAEEAALAVEGNGTRGGGPVS